MKIFQIFNDEVYYKVPFETLAEAKRHYAENILLVEAPDSVFEGFRYINGEFLEPLAQEGYEYNSQANYMYPTPNIENPTEEEKQASLIDYMLFHAMQDIGETDLYYELKALEEAQNNANEIEGETQNV